MKAKINTNLIIGTIFLLGIITIFYFIPYVHDDWAWGTKIGVERLTTLFKNYNGRWGGNLTILLLSRHRIIKAIFCGLVFFGIVNISSKIVNKKNNCLAYFMVLMLLLIPSSVLAQGILWTSGFVNYVVPVLLILLFIYLNKSLFSEGKSSLSNLIILPFFILGFITSLFIENLTIYNLILSVFVIFYQRIKTKTISLPNIFYSIGSLAGAVLMFSNGAYLNVFNNTDTYRTIEQGNIIVRAFNSYFDIIYKFLFHNNYLLNIIIGLLVLVVTYIFFKDNNNISKRKKYNVLFLMSIIIGYISYLVFTIFVNQNNIFVVDRYRNMAEAVAPIIYYISCILVLNMTIMNNIEKKKHINFFFASIILLNAPLFIVTPVAPRCFVANYVFFSLVSLELFDYITNYYNVKIRYVIPIACFALLLYYFMIFGYVYKIESIRTNTINNNKNASKLVLPRMPHSNYLHHADPVDDLFEYRFKLFYNIDQNVKLKFVSYKTFKQQSNKK